MKKTLILTAVILISVSLNAQQLANSNFYNYNLYLINAAMAGSSDNVEATFSHRIQWLGLVGAPTSDFLAIHSKFGKQFGVGAKFNYDKTDIIGRLNVMGSASYRLTIKDHHKLSIGASVGILQNSMRLGQSVTFDPLDEIVVSGNMSAMALNAELALAYNWKGLSLGAAIQQLPETSLNYELPGGKGMFELNRQYDFFGRYSFTINEKLDLNPTAIVRMNEGGPTQSDLIAEMEWSKKLKVALGYRTHAGLITQLGFRFFDRYMVAYSYEFPTGGIAAYSSGSHEFMLGISLARPGEREKEPEMTEIVVEEATLTEELILEEHVKEPNESEPLVNQKIELAPEPEPPPSPTPSPTPTPEPSLLPEIEEPVEEMAQTESEERIIVPTPTPIANDLFDRNLQFELGQSDLNSESKALLDDIAAAMKQDPDIKLLVRGHACDLGSTEINVVVSQARADAVSDYLVSKGVDQKRITKRAESDSIPLVPNTSAANRQKNRRVDFEVLK